MKKTYSSEDFRRKSLLLTIEHFFSKFKIMQVEWRHQQPEAATGACSMRKNVHRNFAKFIGKHLHQSLFFNNVADLRPSTGVFP